MFQIQAPILIVPTADAKLAVGIHLQAGAGRRGAAWTAGARALISCQRRLHGASNRSPSHAMRGGFQMEIQNGSKKGI
jgi:hypothetical protein